MARGSLRMSPLFMAVFTSDYCSETPTPPEARRIVQPSKDSDDAMQCRLR